MPDEPPLRAWASLRSSRTKKGADDFLSHFERAVSSPTPAVEKAPWEEIWDEVWRAHTFSTPLRVQVVGRAEGGFDVTYRGMRGRLLEHGAPCSEPPAEVDAWVLRLDRDRRVLELLAWSPKTGPGRGASRDAAHRRSVLLVEPKRARVSVGRASARRPRRRGSRARRARSAGASRLRAGCARRSDRAARSGCRGWSCARGPPRQAHARRRRSSVRRAARAARRLSS